MKSNNIYLNNYTYDEAIKKYTSAIKEVFDMQEIKISTKDSLGYVLSKPAFAKVSAPNFTASAMDGIAVDYIKTLGASENNYIILKKNIDYEVVDTGDYIKPIYNCVIMVEDLIHVDKDTVKITSPIGFFENIRSTGEDIVKTQMILPSYHKIRAVDIGALLSGGIENVYVCKPLSVAIMPTGTEIVDISKGNLDVGEIIDSNSYMLKALAKEIDLDATVTDIVKDDYNLIKEKISELTSKNDIVFVNAGSSAGREDFTRDVLNELGKVIVHGVAIKPGKPVVLSIVNNKMVVGIPGYPVASYIIFDRIIKPIINNIFQIKSTDYKLNCTLTKRINSSLKYMEFIRVKIGFVNGKWVATPLARGAGVSMSLVESDAILCVPKAYEGFEKGEQVEVNLSKPLDELKKQIVSIGSHDLIIDIIKDALVKEGNEINIGSTHVGSLGGILTLKNKECFMAPIHILDEETGKYNTGIINQFFKNEKMALIKGVKREQGLIVKKGNPLNIQGINDLKRCKYVNRQRGSGTYILLEYLIKQANIDKKDITGFGFSVPTHFDVAINVKEGIADCGLGIYSVAKALDLDFVKIANEDYDFLMYYDDLETEKTKAFIKALKSDVVKKELEKACGYELDGIAEVMIFE